MDGSPTATVYLVVRLPSQHDYPEGLAHYAEHLVWKNIQEADSDDSNPHSNAWTNHSTVGYWVSGPVKDLSDMLGQIVSVFKPIVVDSYYAEQEANIVQRERDLRFSDNVDATAYTDMNQFLYKGNVTASSVIGDSVSIEHLNLAAAKEFHVNTHRPKDTVLAVVGDISQKAVLKAIKKTDLPVLTELNSPSSSSVFKSAGVEQKLFVFEEPSVQSRLVWRKLVKLKNTTNYDRLDLVSRVLGYILETNLKGGLAGPLRYQEFVASAFNVNVRVIDEQHVEMWFSATPDSGITLAQLQTAFEIALQETARGEIPASTFDRVINREGVIQPDWDDKGASNNWMRNHVLNRITVGREPLSQAALRQYSKGVTVQSVNDLLSAFAQSGRTAVAHIKNQKEN